MLSAGVNIVRRFNPHAIGVESNGFQEYLGDDLQKALDAQSFALTVVPIESKVNKENRIRSLDPYLRTKRIRVRNTAGGNILVHQLREFPMAAHDDGPDALEMAVSLLRMLIEAQQSDADAEERVYS